MSQMNVLPIDNVQVTETATVSSDASLGPWNKSSGKFADLINQHQKEHSGKSDPKGGKDTEQSVTSTAKSEQSVTKTAQANDKADDQTVLKAEETVRENAEKAMNETASAQEKSSESTTDTSSVNLLAKAAVTQQALQSDDKAEHLKLLAMLEAADAVSTEHKTSQDNNLPATEEAKLAKLLAGMQSLTEHELSKLKDKFAKAEGDKAATLAIKQLESSMKGDPQVSTEVKEKSASSASEAAAKLQTKFSQSGDGLTEEQSDASDAKADTTKGKLNAQTTTTHERHQLTTAIEQAQTNSKVDANGKVSNAAVTEKLASEELATKSKKETTGDKSVENNHLKAEASIKNGQLINPQVMQKETIPQSVGADVASLATKPTESSKDITGSNNSSVKESSSGLERLNSTQQFSQNNSESKEQSGQEKHTNDAKTAIKNNNVDVELAKATSDFSGNQHLEKDAVTDVKQSLITASPKEVPAFKPVEINPHNNIHSTSFVQAEEQAAVHVIEKAASDAVDAMTQKKTLNLHNETIAIYRKDFNVAVKDKVMVMISQKLQQIEIRLDPPELGSMHVKVNLQNEQAVVSFVVQNQQAKDALEQNMGKLRDMLAQNGVDVGDANVEQQQQQASSENGDSSRNRHLDQGNSAELDDQQKFIANANLYKASATGIDYYA